MLDLSNNQVRRVITPIGEGRLVDYNPNKTPAEYCVAIRKEDTKEQVAGPFVFKWYTAEELSEVAK